MSKRAATNRVVVDAANTVLGLAGARLIGTRHVPEFDALTDLYPAPLAFSLNHTTFELFAHAHNCGWPYLPTSTERTVELALADRWLTAVDCDRVIEVGAVTPYYWPRRVANVVDPADSHSLVTIRRSVFDVNLTGATVLSISTIEHIGTGDYGLADDPSGSQGALEKLFLESPRFLVTFASGYNRRLDQVVLSRGGFPADVAVALLVRNVSGVGWREKLPHADSLRGYGPFGNSVFVITRGMELFDRP